jgi:hypothetical protein
MSRSSSVVTKSCSRAAQVRLIRAMAAGALLFDNSEGMAFTTRPKTGIVEEYAKGFRKKKSNYPGRWVWITQPAGRRSGVMVLR